MKKTIIAGNWKMNTTPKESKVLAQSLTKWALQNTLEIIVFPPFTSLDTVSNTLKSTPIRCGSQTISEYKSGAYTGEISSDMIKACGCSITLVGHSERRHVFGETNATINQKTMYALSQDLDIMLCIGETLEERNNQQTESILAHQLNESLANIHDFSRIFIAYEPVWAIGTGLTAQPEQAESAHQFIKAHLQTLRSHAPIPILYGGSVNPKNIAKLIQQPHVDGVLVGGASLDPESFEEIIKTCQKQNVLN